MKRVVLLFVALTSTLGTNLFAQETKPYADVAKERAEKIVAPLNLTDTRKNDKITHLVAQQYIDLNRIHASRDEQLKANPQKAEGIKGAANKEVAKLHTAYLKKLGKELNEAQIDELKNGMTYHTVPLTYGNYLLMLPYLSKEDQEKIWAFLIEGREHAMDGGTSKEKHAWFNKYKGKIANHLMTKGYNLKYEGVEWAKRRDLKSSALEITESGKIMTALNLTDKSKAESVRNLIAHQYQQVSKIHVAKTARMDAAQKLPKEAAEKENQAAWEESKVKLDKQRDLFIAALSRFLDKDQVELVKNEITGQGLKKEYEKFQALLPDLTVEQKKKVYDYLVEARENAMNVLTSRERNQWFAKFRGRANNYLAAQGYNLRKATEELEAKKQIK